MHVHIIMPISLCIDNDMVSGCTDIIMTYKKLNYFSIYDKIECKHEFKYFLINVTVTVMLEF